MEGGIRLGPGGIGIAFKIPPSQILPFKIEGQYLAGEDFESGPYPTWEEADAAFHQMRLARIDGTLPPVKSQRIVPTAAATA